MRPVRVAVQEGDAFVRVAGAADGPPWLIAEVPAPGPGPAALLAELVGPPPEELVLVHPARWPPARAARWAQECAGLAARVRTVPAPLAAAGAGDVAVLDVGASVAEAALLSPDGRVLAVAAAEVGGGLLDELVAARTGKDLATARAAREALSLLPAVDGVEAADVRPLLAEPLRGALATLHEVLAGAQRILLIGGLARTPLLARVLDESGLPDVEVARRPEAAAVLGALDSTTDPYCCPEGRGAAVGLRSARYLPELPPRRRTLRVALSTVAAAGAVVGLLVLGRLLVPPDAEAEPAGVLAQYGYRLDVPAGWEHTGGLPERRRVLLTRVAAPEGSDLIVAEHSSLGYDTAAEPQRARAELRAAYDAAAAAEGSAFSGYDPGAELAGRPVTSYRQAEPGGTVVDWFVVLDRDAQLSVGCRHTPAGAEAVRAACAAVVASVRAG